jgi:general secretion pathway protein M
MNINGLNGLAGLFKGIDGGKALYVRFSLSVAVAVLLMLAAFGLTMGAKRVEGAKSEELTAFNRMMEEYEAEGREMAPFQKRLKHLLQTESAGALMEEIGSEIGVSKQMASFKAIDAKQEKGYYKNGVQVKLSGISLNELLNLIYRIENHKSLLVIRGFSMNAHFDDPALLDAEIQVVLVAKKKNE